MPPCPLSLRPCTVQDWFNFATEIVEQYFSKFMGSLDIDSLFTNIPLEETIEICTSDLFKNSNIVNGLKKKGEFKKFIFSNQKVVFYI